MRSSTKYLVAALVFAVFGYGFAAIGQGKPAFVMMFVAAPILAAVSMVWRFYENRVLDLALDAIGKGCFVLDARELWPGKDLKRELVVFKRIGKIPPEVDVV